MSLPQLQTYISYAISQLQTNNQEHSFEDLCLDFFKHTIAENCVPSTGIRRGDGGVDFQTFSIYNQSGHKTNEVTCACSFNKKYKVKIKSDVQKILESCPKVKHIYFFAGLDIPKLNQIEIKREIETTNDIELTIFDLHALSYQLNSYKLFPVADKHLNIPSEMYPRPDEDNWYSELLCFYKDNQISNIEQFFEVKSAIREYKNNPDLLIDTSFWISKLSNYKTNVASEYFISKIQYEIAWAYFMALKDYDSFSKLYNEYVESYIISTDIQLLKDALAMINCALVSAKHVSILRIEFTLKFKEAIDTQIDNLLENSSNFDKGDILLLKLNSAHIDYLFDNTKSSFCFKILKDIIHELEHVSFSSITDTYDYFDKFHHYLKIDPCEIESIYNRLDKLIEKQEGKIAASTRIKKRVYQNIDDKDFYNALNNAHKLKELLFQKDSIQESIQALIPIVHSYYELGLLYPAKFYSQVAIMLCLQEPDEYVSEYAPQLIYTLATIDFLLGNWFSYFILIDAYFICHYHYTQTPLQLDNEHQQNIVNNIIQLKNIASSNQEYSTHIDHLISTLNCDYDLKSEILKNAQKQITNDKFIVNQHWNYLESDFRNRPFNDIGNDFSINFTVTGIAFHISAINCFENRALVEEVAFYLQVIISNLYNQDILHFKSCINITVKSHNSLKPNYNFTLDKSHETHVITLPCFSTRFDNQKDIVDFSTNLLGIACQILSSVILLPRDELSHLFSKVVKSNIINELLFKFQYRNSYALTYDYNHFLDEWKKYEEKQMPSFAKEKKFNNRYTCDILKYDEPSKYYNKEEILRIIKLRYTNISTFLKPTLSLNSKARWFTKLLKKYRTQGYLDWEILSALFNYCLEIKVKRLLKKNKSAVIKNDGDDETTLSNKAANIIMSDLNSHNSAIKIKQNDLTEEHLSMRIKMNYRIELSSLDLIYRKRLFEDDAIKDFLSTRYNFGTLDVEHEKLF